MTRRRAPPLDSPNWWPLAELHAWLTRRIGNRHFAASDLTDVLKADRVRCLARQTPPLQPPKKLWPAAFWNTYELTSWSDGLKITPRRESGIGRARKVGRGFIERQVLPMKGVTLYGWGPDLKKTWPELEESFAPFTRPPAVAPTAAESLGKPGHPVVHDWAKIRRLARRIADQIPGIERAELFMEIQQRLSDQGIEPPGNSALYEYFNDFPLDDA
jgi:hypothetical protein